MAEPAPKTTGQKLFGLVYHHGAGLLAVFVYIWAHLTSAAVDPGELQVIIASLIGGDAAKSVTALHHKGKAKVEAAKNGNGAS